MKHILPLLLALAIAASGCGSTKEPPQASAIRNLTTIDDLRNAFNATEGRPRLILLISPT